MPVKFCLVPATVTKSLTGAALEGFDHSLFLIESDRTNSELATLAVTLSASQLRMLLTAKVSPFSPAH